MEVFTFRTPHGSDISSAMLSCTFVKLVLLMMLRALNTLMDQVLERLVTLLGSPQ